MIGGLALASVTATCTVLWWMSTLKLKERLDKASETAWRDIGSEVAGGSTEARLHRIGRPAGR